MKTRDASMEKLFPGHFRPSARASRNIWQSALFVLDANILLNLYRYSDTIRKELLRILAAVRDRPWLPHRAAEEYLSNRLAVVEQQEKAYDETVKTVKALLEDLENARQHPFVSQQSMRQIDSVFDALCDELTENKKTHTKRIHADEIKDSIAEIFRGRVEKPYEKEALESIVAEGELRYSQKIPPGFKDGSKAKDSDIFTEQCRKYGDLILWKQVIDKTKAATTGVILVTDDRKEDWWESFKGKTIGPRPELVKEFAELTGSPFLMYQADRFLELARENLNETISDESVEEIREVRRRDKLASRKKSYYERSRKSRLSRLLAETEVLKHELERMDAERHRLQAEEMMLSEQWRTLRMHRDALSKDLPDADLDAAAMRGQMETLDEKRSYLATEMERTAARRHELQTHLAMLEQQLADRLRMLEED